MVSKNKTAKVISAHQIQQEQPDQSVLRQVNQPHPSAQHEQDGLEEGSAKGARAQHSLHEYGMGREEAAPEDLMRTAVVKKGRETQQRITLDRGAHEPESEGGNLTEEENVQESERGRNEAQVSGNKQAAIVGGTQLALSGSAVASKWQSPQKSAARSIETQEAAVEDRKSKLVSLKLSEEHKEPALKQHP